MSRADILTELDIDALPPDIAAEVYDLMEIADDYEAEAHALRRRLADANAITTEQAATIATLRAQLHTAGLTDTSGRWQFGKAA